VNEGVRTNPNNKRRVGFNVDISVNYDVAKSSSWSKSIWTPETGITRSDGRLFSKGNSLEGAADKQTLSYTIG
jgi:hypothetical protein